MKRYRILQDDYVQAQDGKWCMADEVLAEQRVLLAEWQARFDTMHDLIMKLTDDLRGLRNGKR